MNEPWGPHVTVAAVIAENGRYLVVEEETSSGLRLNQPAGHLEPGESLLEAVVRETREETACGFTPQGLLGIYMTCVAQNAHEAETTYLRFAFTGTCDARQEGRALDTGIVRTLWMSRDELWEARIRHRSPLVMRCVEDHASGRSAASLGLIHTDPSAIFRP